VAGILRHSDEEEVVARQMVMTGILAIQAGDNPRIIAQKLSSFLAPGAPEYQKPGQAGDAAADDAERKAA
jgi:chemotaxis protein MotA